MFAFFLRGRTAEGKKKKIVGHTLFRLFNKYIIEKMPSL